MPGRSGAGRTPPIDPFVQTSLDKTLAQPPTIPSPLMRPLRNPNICRGTLAQPQHLSLSFRTQRSGVRNLKPIISKRRFAACAPPTTMAEHPRFLAMLGMTSYNPAVQTAHDGPLAQPPTIPSSLMGHSRNSNICRGTLRAAPTSVIVIPNAAQRSEESKAHFLQTAFRGLHRSDDDGGTP